MDLITLSLAKKYTDQVAGSWDSDAILYTPQTLTESQKAQARTNIGAENEVMLVQYRGDDPQSSATKNATQIFEHVRQGGTAVFELEHTNGFIECYILLHATEQYATFIKIFDEELIDVVMISNVGDVEFYSHTFATRDMVHAKISTPSTAEVGQTIVVKSVDANGKPTAWEAVDLPSGGGADLMLFRLSGVTHLLIDGMTWEEWAASKYNTPGVYIEDSRVFDENGDEVAEFSTENPVSAVATIIAGQQYMTL